MLKPRLPMMVALCALALLGLTACSVVDLPYTDSFDEDSGEWSIEPQDSGEMGYQDGEFTIRINDPHTDVWNMLPVNQADVIIEVDARTVFGTFRNDYGVMCRYHDGAFYYFAISADGYAAIMLVDVNAEQTFTVLAPASGMMVPDEAIRRGYETNHIRAECSGSELMLEVNGDLILSTTDDTLTNPGSVGLVAGTFERGGVRVNFDDFSVTATE